MYKTDLVRSVAKDTRLSQRLVNDVLTGALATISQTLSRGQTVTLPGFGTFYTRQYQGGSVRSIRSGETIPVAPRRQAAFRVGELLREAARTEKARPGRPRRSPEAAA